MVNYSIHFRTSKGTKRKAPSAYPAASTSKQPKVKRETHDDPLGDEDFGDFIDDGGASDDDDDDGDDVSLNNRPFHFRRCFDVLSVIKI